MKSMTRLIILTLMGLIGSILIEFMPIKVYTDFVSSIKVLIVCLPIILAITLDSIIELINERNEVNKLKERIKKLKRKTK